MNGTIQYRNKRNRITPWLNQYYATSGNVPSENALNEIIQAELAQSYQDRMRQQSLALQREQLDAQKKAWSDARDDRSDARDDRQEQMLWGGLGQLGTAAIGALGKEGLGDIWDWSSEKVGQGADYVKGALGFGAPSQTQLYTSPAYDQYTNDDTYATRMLTAEKFNPYTTSGGNISVKPNASIPYEPIGYGETAATLDAPPMKSAIQFKSAPVSGYDYETTQAEKAGILPRLQAGASGLNANSREGLIADNKNQAINATKNYQGIELSKKYNNLFNWYLSRGFSKAVAGYKAKKDLGLE